jgi:hypothetical protein
VEVVGLDGVVGEPEIGTGARLAERALELADERNGSEGRDPAADAERDVARVVAGEAFAAKVRDAGIRSALAAGARPASAPAGVGSERELELHDDLILAMFPFGVNMNSCSLDER